MGVIRRLNAPNTDPRAAVRQGAEEGVGNALQHFLQVARTRAPRDEGTLQRSGATNQAGTQGVVAFDTPYAVRQHEELTWHHPRGGQAKYLESALNDERDTASQLISQPIRRNLGGTR